MKPRSFGIEEYRIADFDLDITVAHRIIGAYALADALRAVCDDAQPDPVAEHRRERDRGHVALIVPDGCHGSYRQEMRARAQPRPAVDRAEAGERRSILREKRWPLRHHAADAVFLRRNQPSESQIARGELPVDLLTGDMTFLNAHHAKRLDAVRRDPEL